MIGPAFRLARWAALRLAADHWRRRTTREMARARHHHRRFLLFRGRAADRDERADALYPRPATAPPAGHDPAGAVPAQDAGPQSRDTGQASRLPPHPRGIDVTGG